MARVRERIGKNEGLTIWALLDQRWRDTVEWAAKAEKTTYSTWTRKAAKEVEKLGQTVEPRAIVETVLAIYLMQELAGHRFKGDRAFDTQLVRRVRALTQANAHVSYRANGRTVRAYSELPPKTTAVMAKWIGASLGKAGVWLARGEKAKEERRREADQTLNQGLTEIDFG